MKCPQCITGIVNRLRSGILHCSSCTNLYMTDEEYHEKWEKRWKYLKETEQNITKIQGYRHIYNGDAR